MNKTPLRKKRIFDITILGFLWKLRLSHMKTAWGFTRYPTNKKSHSISIDPRQTPREKLLTLIHELAHAHDPHKEECWVESFENAVDEAMDHLGLEVIEE